MDEPRPRESKGPRRPWLRRLWSYCLWGLLLAPLFASAAGPAGAPPDHPARILVVVSQRTPIYLGFTDQVLRGLRAAKVDLAPPLILTPAQVASSVDSRGRFPDVDLIIPVGTRAAQAVAGYSTNIPVYFTLIPRAAYERVTTRFAQNFGAGRSYSALYLDQPLERKLALARFGLPSAHRIGVMLGPATHALRTRLVEAASSAGLELVVREVRTDAEIQPALEALLRQSDAILALPDPEVYNRITIRNILITSFRYRKPVIGYSASFVKAGALMAVYSSPEQLSAEVARRLAPLLNAPAVHLPPAHSPDAYAVDVNYWVADSLGIPVPQRETIEQALQRFERRLDHD